MRKSALRFTALVATLGIAGSASAQQAATTPFEAGAAPNWDVLIRPRTLNPTSTTAAITPSDLRSRVYIFADDSMQGRLLATPGPNLRYGFSGRADVAYAMAVGA